MTRFTRRTATIAAETGPESVRPASCQFGRHTRLDCPPSNTNHSEE
jgi:hypothetical protein